MSYEPARLQEDTSKRSGKRLSLCLRESRSTTHQAEQILRRALLILSRRPPELPETGIWIARSNREHLCTELVCPSPPERAELRNTLPRQLSSMSGVSNGTSFWVVRRSDAKAGVDLENTVDPHVSTSTCWANRLSTLRRSPGGGLFIWSLTVVRAPPRAVVGCREQPVWFRARGKSGGSHCRSGFPCLSINSYSRHR